MNYCVTLEKFLEFDRVVFYTIRKESNEKSEAQDFFDRFINDPTYQDEIKVMREIMRLMGKYGANRWYFRHEGQADALPPHPPKLKELFDDISNDFKPLRLYAMPISRSVVILFNGDLKTTNDPLDCPNVGKHFRDARKMVKLIDRAISQYKEIVPSEKHLEYDNDYEICI